MSRNAYTEGRSSTDVLGISPATILQKRQSPLIGCASPSNRLANAQSEILEPCRESFGRRREHRCERADVVRAHREDPPVEVSARHLDHVHVATEHLAFGCLELGKLREVDPYRCGEIDG